MQVLQPSQNVCSSKEQSHIVLPAHEYQVNQCVVYEDQDETSKWECTAHDIFICDYTSCQSTRCVHMWLVKPVMSQSSHMWSVKSAMKQSPCKKCSQVSFCDDKKYQFTKSLHDDKNCQSTRSLCDDKNSQSTRCVHMWPVKPAMPQSSYKKVTQSTHLWSGPKAARKQIGTQPEVAQNCEDSTSKSLYPSLSTNVCPDSVKMQSNHIWPVKAEFHQKSQVNTRSQVQTSKCKRNTMPK